MCPPPAAGIFNGLHCSQIDQASVSHFFVINDVRMTFQMGIRHQFWDLNSTCSFPNSVSSHDPLTCGDTCRLTRCHRAFVSNPCHFFQIPFMPAQAPWRVSAPRLGINTQLRHVTAAAEPTSRVIGGYRSSAATIRIDPLQICEKGPGAFYLASVDA